MGSLLNLFIVFLKIGAFSIGGGYAVIPLIQQHVVVEQQWLTLQEYIDIITISQMTPGPLAVNTSTFVGLRIAGLPGAIVATLGCILTGCVISLLFYLFYLKLKDKPVISDIITGLKSASLGLIITAGVGVVFLAFMGNMSPNFAVDSFNVIAVLLFGIAFVMIRKFKINPIFAMLMTGVAGMIVY